MRSSIFIAVAIAVAATAWIASGQFGDTEGNASSRNPRVLEKPVDAPLISVRVKAVQAQTRTGYVLLNGRTEESRRVTLRAETRGPIVDVPGEEGHTLEAGDVIARQNVEDRKARMAEGRTVFTGLAENDTLSGTVVAAPNPLRAEVDLEHLARITP